MLSAHDIARQRFWSLANLPDSAQLLSETAGDMSGSTWAPVGTPLPCRVSILASQGANEVVAMTMRHNMMWHVVFDRDVTVLPEYRIQLTVTRGTQILTFLVEVLSPHHRSSATETRVLVRGPLA